MSIDILEYSAILTLMNVEATVDLPEWLAVLKKQVEAIKFGAVQVTVHDARVVQIETTQKVRFDQGADARRSH